MSEELVVSIEEDIEARKVDIEDSERLLKEGASKLAKIKRSQPFPGKRIKSTHDSTDQSEDDFDSYIFDKNARSVVVPGQSPQHCCCIIF